MDDELLRSRMLLTLQRALNDDGTYDVDELEGDVLDTLVAMVEEPGPENRGYTDYGARYRRPPAPSVIEVEVQNQEVQQALRSEIERLTASLDETTEELAVARAAISRLSGVPYGK